MVPIDRSEHDQFLAMAVQYFSLLNSSFIPQEDWKKRYFETIQASPNLFLRWLMYSGQRVGFILFGIEQHRFLPRQVGTIYELFVTPEFRRRGIARTCAEQVISELQTRGLSKIDLEVVEGNVGAVDFWKSMGFRKATQRFVLTDGKP